MNALDIPHRAEAIERTFANAFAALIEFRKLSPTDADRIAAAALATIRNAFPQALRADVESAPFVKPPPPGEDAPILTVMRPLRGDAWYEVSRALSAEGDCVRLYLHENGSHDAAVTLTTVEVMRLRADVDAVASQVTP